MKHLLSSLEIPIRFSETDAMGVVWHGNYLKFFEDAREHFGKQHGLDNVQIHAAGFYIPIVHSELFHKSPLHYGEVALVIAKLIYRESAKVIFEFEVINKSTGQISATGSTTQVFLDAETRLLELAKPAFIIEWENKQNWMDGK